MDSLWLHGQSGQPRFIDCTLTDRCLIHQGKSIWEIDQLRQAARALTATARPKETKGRVTLIDQIQSVVREAEAMRPIVVGISDSERTGAILDNRRAELQELRRRDAVRPDQPDAHKKGKVVSLPTALPARKYSLPDITEILRSFSEAEEED
jgi:hypothetical protein